MAVKSLCNTQARLITNEEIDIKALLLSSLITLTFVITPAWGVSERPTAITSTSAGHKVTKARRATGKPEAATAPPVMPALQMVPQATAAPASPAGPSINPYLPVATAAMAVPVVATPTAPAGVLAPPPNSQPVNPDPQPVLFHPTDTNQPQGVFFPAIGKTPSGELIPAVLSYLPDGFAKLPEVPSFSDISAQLRNLVPVELLALLPVNNGESHWPISWNTVYPTGARPLWVLTLKCPTEAAFGVAPPPVKLVHVALTAVMDGLNSTKLLPIDLQQVCR